MLHFAAITPNLGPHQEFRAGGGTPQSRVHPNLLIQAGKVALPEGPGLGIEYDERWISQAEVERERGRG